MKQLSYFGMFVLCLSWFPSPSIGTDLALVSGSTGTNIVLRSIELIDKAGKLIFEKVFKTKQQVIGIVHYVKQQHYYGYFFLNLKINRIFHYTRYLTLKLVTSLVYATGPIIGSN